MPRTSNWLGMQLILSVLDSIGLDEVETLQILSQDHIDSHSEPMVSGDVDAGTVHAILDCHGREGPVNLVSLRKAK